MIIGVDGKCLYVGDLVILDGAHLDGQRGRICNIDRVPNRGATAMVQLEDGTEVFAVEPSRRETSGWDCFCLRAAA